MSKTGTTDRDAGVIVPPADDRTAAELRGFGPIGILAIVVILSGNLLFTPLSALLVLVWVVTSKTPWSEIGYVRGVNWPLTIAGGIVFGVVFKLLMKALVMPLLGADPVNHAYHYLEGNKAALPGAIYSMIVVAGFGEETVFRGWMFERLYKILGTRAAAKILIVVGTSALFGIEHYSVQGTAGAEQAAIVGLVLGGIFAVTGSIWLLMVAHAAFDLTALWLIYANLETTVAHLILK